jgi:3-deoxy-7-phosphoheptulonate synthase
MIIVMKKKATKEQIQHVVDKIEKAGLKAHPSVGVERTIIGAIGDERILRLDQIKAIKGVEKVTPILKPYKLASREFRQEDTIIKVDGIKIGGNELIVMAGPCAVENREQIIKTAISVKKSGAKILRGGAFKPRTGPYTFQGLGEEGLKYLAEARDKTGLLIVTEVMDPRDVELVAEYSDILQIGTRNMQNYPLLKEVGKVDKPILLKRGLSATMKEFLLAAEYIMSGGNHKVILCERGIRTFVTDTRNTLDLSIVPLIKKESHLPIVIDPSHGTGRRSLVPAMTKASVAVGADGLILEVHPNPEEAVSDGDQSLDLKQFSDLMNELKGIAKAVGRKI